MAGVLTRDSGASHDRRRKRRLDRRRAEGFARRHSHAAAKAELRKILHPHTVKVITVDSKPVSGETVRAVSTYFILYVLIAAASVLLVSLDGYDGSTTLTAVLATFNNIGPGLGLCGPAGNFAFFSPLAKVVLCIDMLLGRLELYPMLVLLMPSTWRKK